MMWILLWLEKGGARAEAGKQVGARLWSVSRDKGDFGKL